ncbi:MAG: hypothetical protein WCZ89_08380 [Phycisphaerae bacterium]
MGKERLMDYEDIYEEDIYEEDIYENIVEFIVSCELAEIKLHNKFPGIFPTAQTEEGILVGYALSKDNFNNYYSELNASEKSAIHIMQTTEPLWVDLDSEIQRLRDSELKM